MPPAKEEDPPVSPMRPEPVVEDGGAVLLLDPPMPPMEDIDDTVWRFIFLKLDPIAIGILDVQLVGMGLDMATGLVMAILVADGCMVRAVPAASMFEGRHCTLPLPFASRLSTQ